jgi:acyl-CoA thioesterase-1
VNETCRQSRRECDDAFVDDAQLKLPDGLPAAGIEAVVTRILPKVEALIDRTRRRDR